MIFHYANKRIRKLASNINYSKNNNGNNRGDKSSIGDGNNNNNFIVVPYVRDVTETVKDSIIKNPDIKVEFHCLNKLNRFIKLHKDKNTTDECSNVVTNHHVKIAMSPMLDRRKDNLKHV